MSSVARAGRLCARAAVQSGLLSQPLTAPGASGASQTSALSLQQRCRWMSGGHHGPGVTHEGLTLHEPARWHKVVGEGFAAVMWFWVLVRAYHDGSTLLFGHAPHFEHEDHHESSEAGDEH